VRCIKAGLSWESTDSVTWFESKRPTGSKAWLRWFAGRNEALMFSLALLHLMCVAVLVVLWVDVPWLEKRTGGDGHLDATLAKMAATATAPSPLERLVLTAMTGIWLVVGVEAVVHWTTRPWDGATRRHHWHSLLCCVFPALRLAARSPEMRNRIWLPGMGWRRGGPRLKRQLERHLSVPMMVIALLIMPILITEFFLKDQVAAYTWLRIFLHVGTGVIWFAFAAEFIVMVSVAEKKLAYCKEHWIDLAIILLPLVSFLRTLSVARTTRLASLMRIQQLSNLVRAYRLRGTALKAFRVLVLFDLTERLLRVSDERRIAKMEKELAEMEKQSRLLRQRIARLKLKADREDSTSDPAPADLSLATGRKWSPPLDASSGEN
jgi:voltage-gated potassium channel